jgi:predicted dehydrogenase
MNPPRRTFLKAAAVTAVLPALARADKPRIKVGQIGTGHGHATKLAVYRRSEDYEVVGVVEPDEKLRLQAMFSPAFRDVKWLTRDQLLNTPGLQAVLVETKVRDLLDTTEACVAAGKHVHLDKPAGESLPQFRRILDAAAKQKLLVQMGYMYRYNPAVVLLREFLAKGWLGDVFEVHAVMSKVVDPAGRKDHGAYRGGMMFELGCHLIDLVVGLLGKPTKVTAHARHSSKVDDALLDNMLAVFDYPRATATVRSTGLEVEGFDRRHLVVCGTAGTFHIQPLDNPKARVALSAARDGYKKGYQDVTFPKFERYVADAADMAKVIRGEKASDYAAAHDLNVQEAVLQASGVG